MNEPISTPPIRTPSRSPETWWFWWGIAWGAAASLAGASTAFFHFRSEANLLRGPRGLGSTAEPLGDSLMATVVGLPLTLICSVIFLCGWGCWLCELRNRRHGGPGGLR